MPRLNRRHLLCAMAAAGAAPLIGRAASAASPLRDVLDSAAQPSPLAARALINGLALAGDRVVAVGQRGHVLCSDDQGKQWQQADVPLASDLVAVAFPTATHGWAVGHDGVVIASIDQGRSWQRQLDGRALGEVLVKHYARLGDAKWLAEAQRFAAQGAENPLLDVWFDDARTGY
ncbi:MAG TPA: YCF48-related protein, partial [Burkholderiaceae bacterium]|nr:YCF48-related protein [Burkholderiaceae bacterium]